MLGIGTFGIAAGNRSVTQSIVVHNYFIKQFEKTLISDVMKHGTLTRWMESRLRTSSLANKW